MVTTIQIRLDNVERVKAFIRVIDHYVASIRPCLCESAINSGDFQPEPELSFES